MLGGERVQVLCAAVFVADNAARAQVVDTVIFDDAFRLDVRRFKVREEHRSAAQPAIATGRHTIVHDPKDAACPSHATGGAIGFFANIVEPAHRQSISTEVWRKTTAPGMTASRGALCH